MSQRLPLPFLAALALALAAGCVDRSDGGLPGAGAGSSEAARQLRFAGQATATPTEAVLQWLVPVHNPTNRTAGGARVLIDVKYYGQFEAGSDAVMLNSLEANQTTSVRLQTPYRGPGDYVYAARVQVGSDVVDKQQGLYEYCGTC